MAHLNHPARVPSARLSIGIVIDSIIPATAYGGTERVVTWLGRSLSRRGHRVHYLAREGSRCDFAEVSVLDPTRDLDAQLPAHLDIVHLHTEMPPPQTRAFCITVHGNQRQPRRFHPNTIFVSRDHARRHRASAWVDSGLDPDDYGEPDFQGSSRRLVFLAKAAWKVKNVRGAIAVARRARLPIDIIGGTRLNLRMGFRLTLDPNARFHGMIGGEPKNSLLRQGAALVFPVRWHEPAGLALMEASWFGLPVLGSPYGSLTDYVPAHAGVLSTSVDELAEAAQRLHQFDRRAIHAWCRERFTADRMARDYEAIYERILAGETLHPEAIDSPATRDDTLLAWRD